MPFDTLKLARRLQGAGFSVEQSQGLSEALAEATGELVTKSDLRNALDALAWRLMLAIVGIAGLSIALDKLLP
jgi:hypothetical protein